MAIQHSIVVPTYDRPAKLARALRSCFDQTCPPAEIIVADNGQNPETSSTVKAAQAEVPEGCRLKYIQTEPFNVREALATGIEAASHEWIILLDDDDLLLPKRIENDQSIIPDLEPDVVLIVHDFVRVDYKSDMVWHHKMAHKPLDLFDALVLDNFPPPPAGTWRADALKAYHSFKLPEGWTDFDLYASVLDKGRVNCSSKNGYLMDDTRVSGRLTTNIEQTLKMLTLHRERFAHKHALCPQGVDAVVQRLDQQQAFFAGKALGFQAFAGTSTARKYPVETLKGILSPLRSFISRYLADYLPEMRGSKTYTLARIKTMDTDLYGYVNAARLSDQ